VKARQGLPNRNWKSSFVTIAMLSKIDNIKGQRSCAGYVESQLTSIYRLFYCIVLVICQVITLNEELMMAIAVR
jgi:hypothetical protein